MKLMDKDITIIFLTVNKVPEKWAEYQISVLKQAIEDYPIISVSKKPMDLGTNLIQEQEPSIDNIYWQMLRAAKMATTPFIAVAEDDVLYPREHFTKYRPPLDTYAYNYVRWQIHTWGETMFYWRPKLSNYSLIAPREALIKGLEERFEKYPFGQMKAGGELGHQKLEKRIGTTIHKMIEFPTTVGLVAVNHIFSIDPFDQRQVKRMGRIRATAIPYWGKAEEVLSKFQ
jgi:hypothetical protein